MSYNSNVPAGNQTGSQNYQDMQGNYAQIQTSFSVNHKPLASGTGEGFHTLINFLDSLGSDPNLAAPAMSIFSRNVSGVNQLFFQNGNTLSDRVQLTNLTIMSTGTNFGVQTPWGLKLNWGQAQAKPAGTPVVFKVPFTAFQSIVVSPSNVGPSTASTASESNSGFTIYSSETNAAFYFAIGT